MLIFRAEIVAVSECHEHEAFLVGEDIRITCNLFSCAAAARCAPPKPIVTQN
jgi:hypothetical protein